MIESKAMRCPLRDCGWYWGGVSSVDLAEHLRRDHRTELQAMLAGIDGGRGEPVLVGLTQHIAAAQMRGAENLVAATLVPKMRAELARKMAKEGLRPLDPWPPVEVRRFMFSAEGFASPHPDAPGGMRPAEDGEAPDLYALTLETEAVTDTREVTL